MNTNSLLELGRLARVGANSLGQSATPETMQKVWSIIGEAEAEISRLQALPAAEIAVKPEEAPAA